MTLPLELTRSRLGRAPQLLAVDGWLLGAAFAALALLFIALFGERLAPHESIYFVVEHGSDPRPYDPGVVFPFGSDILGRDLLSLVLAGARTTLAIVLIGGLSRVAAGTLVAAVGSWWRPLRLLTESIAELVSAVPATLAALVIVKIFVKADTTIWLFVGALLVIGWAGPYRVVRAEVDRLMNAPFIVGSRSLGIGRWRLFWRHQLPHLLPVLAVNLAQQVVASLVLVAELGVLGTFVGTTRLINIEESLSRVISGPVNAAQIADPPEWGGLLAAARTIESLWTFRWLILVPGLAFAATAIAISLVGFALARRYARRDVIEDLSSRGALAFCALAIVLVIASAFMPPRYAEAAQWAIGAAADVRPSLDTPTAFRDAGLAPIGPSYAIKRDLSGVVQTGPATVTIGATSLKERWPRDTTRRTFSSDLRSLVTAGTGGGAVEADVVYAARGIVPSENPPPVSRSLLGLANPSLGTLIEDYADDYAGIDVRGKIVLLVRFYGFRHDTYDRNGQILARRTVLGTTADDAVGAAVKRGAAGVIYVDPDLPFYTDVITNPPYGPINPYTRAEREAPRTTAGGVPAVIISGAVASGLAAQSGLDLSAYMGWDDFGQSDRNRSASRDIGVRARLDVPIERQELRTTSYLAEVDDVSHEVTHVLLWVVRSPGSGHEALDAMVAAARSLAPRRAPFVFAEFDPSLDPRTNAAAVTSALGARRVGLVIIVRDLAGSALRFATPWGDLIPALDRYAEAAGVRAIATRDTAPRTFVDDTAPFADTKTIFISGNDDGGTADLRADASAFICYLAGRLALGAEELPR